MPSSWHFLPHVPLLDWRLPAPAALHAPATDATSSVRSSSCMRLNGARHACPMEIAVPEPPATTLLGHLHRSKTPQCCLGWPSQCCMCTCRNSLQHTQQLQPTHYTELPRHEHTLTHATQSLLTQTTQLFVVVKSWTVEVNTTQQSVTTQLPVCLPQLCFRWRHAQRLATNGDHYFITSSAVRPASC